MRRAKAEDPLFPIEQRIAQAENQLTDLREGSSSLARISAWDDSDPRTFIGLASALAEGEYIRFTRPANTPYLVIEARNYECSSAFVDSDGSGTHTTIQAAIDDLDDSSGTHIIQLRGLFTESVTIPEASGTHTWTFRGCSPSGYQDIPTAEWTAESGSPLITTSGTTGALYLIRIENLALINDAAHLIQHDGDQVDWEFKDVYAVCNGSGYAFFRANERCNITIDHCYFQGESGNSTPVIQDESTTDNVRSLRIFDSYLEQSHFEILAATNVWIDNTYIEIDTTDSSIALHDVGQLTLTGISVICETGRSFIIKAAAPPVTNPAIRIVSNRFEAGGSAVALELDNLRHVTVDGNVFFGSAPVQGTGLRISASDASGVAERISVQGNVFAGLTNGIDNGGGAGTITASTIETLFNTFDNNTTDNDFTATGVVLPTTAFGHAILDGAAHTDSVADGVTRGSLIYGNSTPAWDELVIGAATTYLKSDGTDPTWTAIQAADVGLPLIGSPTYTHVAHMNTLFHSSGWFSGGAISDAGSATINVTAGTGAIRAADNRVAQLLLFDWSASNGLAITTDTIRYIGVKYGTPPVVTVEETRNWDYNATFPLGIVVNEGGTLHIQQHEHAIGDHANFMIQRMHETNHIQRDNETGGNILGESADTNRRVTVSAGAYWIGLSRFATGALDTDPGGPADTFATYSASGREAAAATQWPNEQYDNGGTLTNMAGNKWANLWFYQELDGDFLMVYGTDQYTSEVKAEAEAVPGTIPDRATVHGTLIGRMIFQKSDGTAAQVQSAFAVQFVGAAAVGIHNILDGGVIHLDAASDSVTEGSLMLANATPKWDELVISVPGANVRNVLGIDNGETVPSWKTALDGTNPAATAGSASPGTSLVFSHRDHVHPYHASHGVTHNAVHGISKHTEHATWKALYTDGSGDEQELALGADGTFLQANGVAAAPTFAALVVGDVPFDDATSDPLIDADAADDGNEGSPARKDHVHPKHHAKYTDAEAVTALEAEDPFDMAGVLNLAKNLNLTKGISANIDGNDEIAVPAVSWLYLTSAGAADTLNGIGAGAEGQVVILTVVAGKDITLAHDAAVVAGQKLMINGEANVVLSEDHDMALAVYDDTANVWNVLVVPGAAGHAEDHKDRHDPEDGADPLDTANAAEISVVVAAGTGTSHSLARADHVHAINHAISNNHIVTIDHAAAADNDYAKFTASGLEGRSYAEVLTDLGSENFPTWANTGITGAELETLSDTSDADALHAHTNHGVTHIAAHAILDGSVHSDSVADAVTAGSIIIGNDTPKWDELVIAVPAANVRNVLGIDNGETTPAWKTALDATNPADIAAAASPGTSLVFSHRDHVHDHPDLAADLHTVYFLADGSRAMTGDINLDGSNIDNGGVIFLKEQAAADADVPGSGQVWVKSGAPNTLYFTDEDGTDVQLGAGGGGGGKGTIWLSGQAASITGTGGFDNTRGNYSHINLGTNSADGSAHWSLRMPSDFTTLTKAVICCLTPNNGDVRYSVATSFDAAGVAQGTTSDSIAGTETTLVSLQLAEIDISAAFTGLAADDIVAIKFTRAGTHVNDTISTFEVYGILLEYTI